MTMFKQPNWLMLRFVSFGAIIVGMSLLSQPAPCCAQWPGGNDYILSETHDAVADPSVAPVTYDAAVPIGKDRAHVEGQSAASKAAPEAKLLPPRTSSAQRTTDSAASAAGAPPATRYPSASTLIGSTCVVLSLFFAVAWLLKRAAPRSMRNLSPSAIEVLGRAPLTRGQHVQLVRCGGRVLLLAVSTTTSQTLTEITDPEEVKSLLSACKAKSSHYEARDVAPHAERDRYNPQRDRVSDLLQAVTGEPSREARHA
jgi:flagellar biogenesis protein FliO